MRRILGCVGDLTNEIIIEQKNHESRVFWFFSSIFFFLKKGQNRRILGGGKSRGFFIFCKKGADGACIFGFWKKVAVRAGTFGWKMCWILVCILKKSVYYRREWQKPPRGRMFSGGAFWQIRGGGLLANNPIKNNFWSKLPPPLQKFQKKNHEYSQARKF